MLPFLVHRARAVSAATGLLAAVALTAGCASSAGTQTAAASTAASTSAAQPSGSRNASGVDGKVGSLSLLSVLIAAPAAHGATYSPGEDVPLSLTVADHGSAGDVLTGVTTPAAGQVVYRVGTGAPAAQIQVAVPAGGAAELRDPAGPHLELVGLTQSLHSAQSVPVTFTFQTAGPTTLNVPVQEYTAQRTTAASPTS